MSELQERVERLAREIPGTQAILLMETSGLVVAKSGEADFEAVAAELAEMWRQTRGVETVSSAGALRALEVVASEGRWTVVGLGEGYLLTLCTDPAASLEGKALGAEEVVRKIRTSLEGIGEAELILKESDAFTALAALLMDRRSGSLLASERSPACGLEPAQLEKLEEAARRQAAAWVEALGEAEGQRQVQQEGVQILLEATGPLCLVVLAQGSAPRLFVQKMRRAAQALAREVVGTTSYAAMPEQVRSLLGALVRIRREEPVVLPAEVHPSLPIPPGRKGIQPAALLAGIAALVIAIGGGAYLWSSSKTQGGEKRSGGVEAGGSEPEVKRLTAALNRLDGFAITTVWTSREVTIDGSVATDKDLAKIRDAFAEVPGVPALVVKAKKLGDLPIGKRIYFEYASAKLIGTEKEGKIRPVAEYLRANPGLRLRLIGHTDPVGTGEKNYQIALARAENVKAALQGFGIPAQVLVTEAVPRPPPDVDALQPFWQSRCVRFLPVAN